MKSCGFKSRSGYRDLRKASDFFSGAFCLFALIFAKTAVMFDASQPVFSLLDVCRSIRKTLSERYGSPFWVKAELHKLNRYPASGHCFPELLQKEGEKVVAQIRGTLWKNDYLRINNQFLQTVREPLGEGIGILFQAMIQYDPQYGLSLRVLDIDPSYVLGSLEKERQICLQRLSEEHLLQRNKNLPFPLLPAKIAVISASTSKGYSDFMQVLEQNPFGYRFYVRLFPALLQGEGAVVSIGEALRAVRAFPIDFDVVMIIRGGGDEVGLSVYNRYELARRICLYPIPVLTGIGHSTNLTVCEEVAWFHGITPTELAVFVLRRFEEYDATLHELADRLRRAVQEGLESRKTALRHIDALLKTPGLHLRYQGAALDVLQERLRRASENLIRTENAKLESTENTLRWADPQRNLKRGYSITYQGDRLVMSDSTLSPGQRLRTILAQGEVRSRVEESADTPAPLKTEKKK